MADRETDTATLIDPRHRVEAETLALGCGDGGSGGEATEVLQRKRALKDDEDAQGLPVSWQEVPSRQQASPCTLALVPSPSLFALQAKKAPLHPSKPPSGSSPPPEASAFLASPPQLSLSTCTSSFKVRSNAIFLRGLFRIHLTSAPHHVDSASLSCLDTEFEVFASPPH